MDTPMLANQLCGDTGYSFEDLIGVDGVRESENSMLPARLDNNDDEEPMEMILR